MKFVKKIGLLHYELDATSLAEIDFRAGDEILCYDEKDNFYGVCGVVEVKPPPPKEVKMIPPRKIQWKN
jgi:hypothetical protein